jgi:hypothetical protein
VGRESYCAIAEFVVLVNMIGTLLRYGCLSVCDIDLPGRAAASTPGPAELPPNLSFFCTTNCHPRPGMSLEKIPQDPARPETVGAYGMHCPLPTPITYIICLALTRRA